MVVRKADRILIGSNSFLSRDATLLPVCQGEALRDETKTAARETTYKQTNKRSARVKSTLWLKHTRKDGRKSEKCHSKTHEEVIWVTE